MTQVHTVDNLKYLTALVYCRLYSRRSRRTPGRDELRGRVDQLVYACKLAMPNDATPCTCLYNLLDALFIQTTHANTHPRPIHHSSTTHPQCPLQCPFKEGQLRQQTLDMNVGFAPHLPPLDHSPQRSSRSRQSVAISTRTPLSAATFGASSSRLVAWAIHAPTPRAAAFDPAEARSAPGGCASALD